MHLPGAGKYDVFIISPAGRPFKTKAELRTYLEKEEQDWTIHLFCLQKKGFCLYKNEERQANVVIDPWLLFLFFPNQILYLSLFLSLSIKTQPTARRFFGRFNRHLFPSNVLISVVFRISRCFLGIRTFLSKIGGYKPRFFCLLFFVTLKQEEVGHMLLRSLNVELT